MEKNEETERRVERVIWRKEGYSERKEKKKMK